MKPTLLMTSTVLLGLGLGGTMACSQEQPPFELRYETEHLRIGVADDDALCGGDLVRFEQHLTRVEGLLSTQMEGKVDMYLWRDDSEGWEEYCGAFSGCYRRETQTIYTGSYSVWHELVHAVALPMGDPSPMWSEGVAKALDIQRTFPGSTAPSDNFFRDHDEVSYESAGHFVRWIWGTHGAQAMRDLLTDTRDPEVAFEAIIGQTLAEAEAEYYAQAPWSFGVLGACQFAELDQVELGQWREKLDLDCENDQTLSGSSGLGSLRTFQVDARGDFEIVSDADQLLIQRCPDENISSRPEGEPGPEQGDVPNSTPGAPGGPSRVIGTRGEGEVLDLAPARYELILVSAEARTVNVEVTGLEPSP